MKSTFEQKKESPDAVPSQFLFEFAVQDKKPYTGVVDYEELREFMHHKPLTRGIIEKLTGCPHGTVTEILDNLTYLYPIYEEENGDIKLLEDETWP